MKIRLLIFSIASFLNDLGSDIVAAIWPVFITSIIGANMSLLGFIDGLGEAISSFSKGASGYFSDRFKQRKIFVWTGYLFSGFSRFGYGISTVFAHLIPFKIIDRLGKFRDAPRDAMLADSTTKKTRGSGFGVLRSADTLGAVVGTLLAFLLLGLLGYRNLFLLASIPSVIGAVLILLFVKEGKKTKKLFKGVSFKNLNFNLKLFFLISIIFSFASLSYSFLIIFAKNFGFPELTLPLLYLVFNVFYFSFAYPFGRVSDKIGRKNVILIAYSLFALMSLGFIFVNNVFIAVLLFCLFGMSKAALDPVQTSFVSDFAPKESRASILGAYQMSIGLAALPGGVIAGLLWDFIGFTAPFIYALVLSVVSILLMLKVKND